MADQHLDQITSQRVARLQGDLTNLVRVIVDGLNMRLAPYEIDTVEYTLLCACLASGPITMRDLRQIVPIDPAHMSRTLSGLEDRELVEKVRPRSDRRLVNVTLTEEAQALIPELMNAAQGFYAIILGNISQEQLVGSMAVMEKMIAGGAPPAK